MNVWTYRYEYNHGKKPRGSGWWLFESGNRAWKYDGWGNYGDVKKEAIKEAKKAGIREIYTAP